MPSSGRLQRFSKPPGTSTRSASKTSCTSRIDRLLLQSSQPPVSGPASCFTWTRSKKSLVVLDSKHVAIQDDAVCFRTSTSSNPSLKTLDSLINIVTVITVQKCPFYILASHIVSNPVQSSQIFSNDLRFHRRNVGRSLGFFAYVGADLKGFENIWEDLRRRKVQGKFHRRTKEISNVHNIFDVMFHNRGPEAGPTSWLNEPGP